MSRYSPPAKLPDERALLSEFRKVADALEHPETPRARTRDRRGSKVTAQAGDLIRCQAGDTVLLPAPRPANGQCVTVVVETAPVTIVATTGLVDGAAEVSLTTAGANVFYSTGAGWWRGSAGPSGLLRRTLYYTSNISGTHTCDPRATHVRLRGGGGGGAGGGANAAAAQGAVGGGASAGGVFDVMRELVAGFDIAYVIGAQALGVQGTTGQNGAATTATYNGETLTGNGGLGSVSSTSGTTVQLLGYVQGGTATTSGVPQADDQYITGGPPGIAWRESATSGAGGIGGDSGEAPGANGVGSAQGASTSVDGKPGQYGSGGGGAVNFNNSPAAGNTGGNGGIGFLWVYEYAIP